MISLGLDPGGASKGLAWALYDDEADRLTVGMHKPAKGADPACEASDFVGGLIERHPVKVIGVEIQHVLRLPQRLMSGDIRKVLGLIYAQAAAALRLAEVVGACKGAAVSRGIPVVDLRPATIKQAMTGKGNASKAEVREQVVRVFEGRTALIRGPREKRVLRQDEADAAAMAVTVQRRAPTRATEGVLL